MPHDPLGYIALTCQTADEDWIDGILASMIGFDPVGNLSGID